jgi:glycosyltransferase involved in cell wall biosynthesis
VKILYNTYPVAFDCPGGGEIQLLKTIEHVQKQGFEIERFDPWKPNFKGVDVVHYFSVQGGSHNFCSYVRNNKNLPLVISPILWPGGDTSGYPMEEIKYLLHISQVLLPNSNLEAKLLSEVFSVPLERFLPVTNGVADLFTSDSQPSLELFRTHFNINEPFILCVGNIEPRKNQLNLVKVFNELQKVGTLPSQMKLILIGNVRDKNYYNQIIENSNLQVQFLGTLDHQSDLLRSAYKACSLFILPSTLETPGLAALEAAVLGAKLAVTEVGSTREYFKDYAVYLNPHDNESIVQAILDGLKLPINENLRQHIKQNFTWEKTAQQSCLAYKKAIELLK